MAKDGKERENLDFLWWLQLSKRQILRFCRLSNSQWEVRGSIFDNDPADIFERQINFIRESAIPVAMVGLLAAIPDTQLWRRLEREGRLMGVERHTGSNTDCAQLFT